MLRGALSLRQGDSVKPSTEECDGSIFVVLECFEGESWRKIQNFAERDDESLEGEDVTGCIVLAVGGLVFVECDVLVAVQIVFDGPMAAVESQQSGWRGLHGRHADDEPCGFVGFDPDPFALDLALAADAGDLLDARPVLQQWPEGGSGQHINAALLDAPVRLGGWLSVTAEGEKPAFRTPSSCQP